MLDRDLRQRLRALAEYDARLLDAETQARVLRRIAVEGPTLVRRARAERVLTVSGGFALAAAACWALVIGVHTPATSAPALRRADVPAVVIALPAGRMTLSAADFGEGELRITTPQGAVVTSDALLAVEARPQTLGVEVVEGSAVIVAAALRHEVRAGSRVELAPGAVTKHALEPAKAAALRKAVERP